MKNGKWKTSRRIYVHVGNIKELKVCWCCRSQMIFFAPTPYLRIKREFVEYFQVYNLDKNYVSKLDWETVDDQGNGGTLRIPNKKKQEMRTLPSIFKKEYAKKCQVVLCPK